ncbi:MAG: hypothetical protein DHS20C17_01220 [Cyclobacteriaceae bacterium]|nr:MAG: hypothetical protein DHS20C17_01220 [Cyclobacteriaceae bacterium]
MIIRLILVVITTLLAGFTTAVAQALTNNNALITVMPSTRFTIMGGALNNGDIENSGAISISGDWMNVDTYSGNGMFILNGDGRQNIAHNSGGVYQLYIEGGGEKVIVNPLNILDSLHMIQGVVTIADGGALTVQSNGGVSGGSDLSYVDGTLLHQGTGYKYFPVGSNGNFRPAELLNVSGTNPIVGVSVHEPNANPVIPLQLLAVSDTRYWQITQQSGTFDGSQVRLKVGPDEKLGTEVDIQDIVVSVSDSIGGLFVSLGQALFSGTMLDGEVTSSQNTAAGYLAIAVEGFAEERGLYVPNALSPAAPNPEDQVVKVYGQQIVDEDFIFRIYNRWGLLIYETSSFTEANTVGWSGVSADGSSESVGVYQYTLAGRFASGKSFNRKGTIKVIR